MSHRLQLVDSFQYPSAPSHPSVSDIQVKLVDTGIFQLLATLSTYPFVATISAVSDAAVCVRIRIFPFTSSDCVGSVIQIQNRPSDLMVKSSS